VYFGGLTACWFSVAALDASAVAAPIIVMLGVLYAHGLELQHECLHGRMIESRRATRIVGILLGAPMLVSYTHYRMMHFHHHKYLGTPNDRELFDYDVASLKSWTAFGRRAWNLERLPRFVLDGVRMALGRYRPVFDSAESRRDVRNEYVFLTALLLGAVLWSLAYRSWLFVLAWFIPWLLIGEVTHFIIELPEHLFCEKHMRDTFANTRTVLSSPLAEYLTNGNNYHVEHHLYPGVAIGNLRHVHRRIGSRVKHVSSSYWQFYRRVLGSIGQ